MTLTMTEIPSMDEEPAAGWESSPIARVLQDKAARRRSVLKFIAVSAVALGMNVVGWLPPGRLRQAAAAYSSWGDCQHYYSSNTICVPESWYHGSDTCYGGWHRNGNTGSNCTLREYRVTYSCNTRNAWHWNHAYGRFRCSDGQLWYHNSYCTRLYTASWCRYYIAA